MFCYDIYCWYQSVLYSSQVDVTVTREALSVVCHCSEIENQDNCHWARSVLIISVMFSILGGLVNFSYLVAHCLHNFWPGNALLIPFSFSILIISKRSTLWALLLQQWYFKMLQYLSAFFPNTFPKNCSWWKQILNTLSFSSNNLTIQSKIHCKLSSSSLIFFLPVCQAQRSLLQSVFKSFPKSHESATCS